MNEYHVFVSNDDLLLIQRDIINDFLDVESSLPIDIDILSAKLSMIINLMKLTRHKSLSDLEYIYKRLKAFKIKEVAKNNSTQS